MVKGVPARVAAKATAGVVDRALRSQRGFDIAPKRWHPAPVEGCVVTAAQAAARALGHQHDAGRGGAYEAGWAGSGQDPLSMCASGADGGAFLFTRSAGWTTRRRWSGHRRCPRHDPRRTVSGVVGLQRGNSACRIRGKGRASGQSERYAVSHAPTSGCPQRSCASGTVARINLSGQYHHPVRVRTAKAHSLVQCGAMGPSKMNAPQTPPSSDTMVHAPHGRPALGPNRRGAGSCHMTTVRAPLRQRTPRPP